MKVSELISELLKADPDAKVLFEWEQYPYCSCPEYCYCTSENHQAKPLTIDPMGKGLVVIRGEKIW